MTDIDIVELASVVGGTLGGHRHNSRVPCIGCDHEPGQPPPLSPTFPRPPNEVLARSSGKSGPLIGW
jgi:hypothetical protein